MKERTEQRFHDKTLLCVCYEKPFLFTAGEQKYYFSEGLAVPKRCAQCRMLRKLTLINGGEL